MHTKDFLADELRKADLPEMANKAATGYYHDFLSPLDMPSVQLAADLAQTGTPAALALRQRAFDGEFDASTEETAEWASSPEGQAVFNMLVSRK